MTLALPTPAFALLHRPSNLSPLYDMTPEQRALVREFLGLEENLMAARVEAIARELGELRSDVRDLRDELHGKISAVEKDISDTQRTNLVEKVEEKQRELDSARKALGMKQRKTDQWRDWVWKVILAIALGMLARHVLGILFPHALGN